MCDFDTMNGELYHREIGLPAGASDPWCLCEFELVYSEHAKREASADRYGFIPMLDIVAFAHHEVVEVEYQNHEPVKAVLRIPCESVKGVDMILVLNRPCHTGHGLPQALVRTVWFNRRDDHHSTLNRKLYKTP